MTSLRREVGPAVDRPGVWFAVKVVLGIASVYLGLAFAKLLVDAVHYDDIVDCRVGAAPPGCQLQLYKGIVGSGTSGHTANFVVSDGDWQVP